MKKLYYILSGFFGIFGLILAFENIATKSTFLFLLETMNTSLFLVVLISFVLGFGAGVFLGLAQGVKPPANRDEDPF